MPHERRDRARGAGLRAFQQTRDALAGQVRVLLGSRQRELPLDDLPRQHEPGVVVPGVHDVRERAEGVEAGEQRGGQRAAARVQPQRRRAGQDPDAVQRPDRVPVGDALGVVPHAVRVDHGRARRRADLQHPPVDVLGDAGQHVLRRTAQPEQVDARDEIEGLGERADADLGGDGSLAQHDRGRVAVESVGQEQAVLDLEDRDRRQAIPRVGIALDREIVQAVAQVEIRVQDEVV